MVTGRVYQLIHDLAHAIVTKPEHIPVGDTLYVTLTRPPHEEAYISQLYYRVVHTLDPSLCTLTPGQETGSGSTVTGIRILREGLTTKVLGCHASSLHLAEHLGHGVRLLLLQDDLQGLHGRE